MPNEVPRRNGEIAARAARRKYGLVDLDGTTGYADAAHRSNGSRVQIKSALFERADGSPGVIRVWREHLEALADVGGSVVVAVVNPSNPSRQVLKVEKIAPAVLLDAGDFRPTGQQSMSGMHEARLPWREVVSL